MIRRRRAAAWLALLTAFVGYSCLEFALRSEGGPADRAAGQPGSAGSDAAHRDAFRLMAAFRSPQDAARANFTPSRCGPIPGVHPHFRVQLCLAGCRGLFRIERVGQDPGNGSAVGPPTCRATRPIANHSLTQAWVQEHIGPDAFMIRFLGPDVVMADTVYKGACVYEAYFELFSPEAYSVRADLMYTDYVMVDEVNYHTAWPPLLYVPLILDPRFVVRCEGAAPNHTDPAPALAPATLCPDGLHRGRWVQDQWHPVGCTLRPPTRVVDCLRGKRVAVFGDSHLLRTFRGLRIALDPSFDENASQIPAIRNLKTATVFHIPALNLSLTYIKAPFMFHSDLKDGKMCCEVPVEEFLPQFDFLLLGFGQHPAAGCCCCNQDGHWPFLRYAAAVARLASLLRVAVARRQAVVWAGITAWQPKKHNMKTRFNLNGEKKSLDWRNNYRLSMYNRVAYAAMQRVGVRVVDAFQVSYPMMHTTKDGAHYLGMVQRSIVLEVLNAFGGWCDVLSSS